MQATRTGLVSEDNTIQLPADCRAVQSLRVNVGSSIYQELHPLPPERLADAGIITGWPIGYVTVGRVLTLIGGSGTPDYAMTYFQQVPALATAPMNINWLIQREPGLYLYATLLEASPYIQDNNMAQVWAQQYQNIAERMQAEDDRARYGNAPAIGSPIRNAP
jgi:hypothetical protein